MTPETEQLIQSDTPAPKKSRASSFGVIFALIFCVGFGVALTYASISNWNKQCDQPLKLFLMGFGATALVAALIFLILELTSNPDEEEGMTPKVFTYFIIFVFFLFGAAGGYVYWQSEDCDTLAAVAYRWTFAGVLAFLCLAVLMISSVMGKFGGPFFALFGYGLANLFQWLADMFKALADAVSENKDPANVPLNRSAAGDFALYINHATVMWFFAYILMTVHDEKDDPCDRMLPSSLLGFGIYGLVMAYFDFLFEKFAGVKTREKLSPFFKFIYAINAIAFIIWGIFNATQVFSSQSCKETSKDVYRLAFLLSLVFLVLVALLALGLCAGILDFLCSGRLRFVVVVEQGDNDEDQN